ncbi:hypothetical protein BT69DRAFT_620319 [Atractiella rhizophila]|nr:hypothetical protein BT69DRAFT_620319 [Atractiella rhizophila]
MDREDSTEYAAIDPAIAAEGREDGDDGERALHLQAPSLHRNQACLPCRARKIRCDAGKPICGQCANPRRKKVRGGKTTELELPRCIYGPNPTAEQISQDPSLPYIPSKRKRVPLEAVEEKDKEINELKEKIKSLERAIEGNAGVWAPYEGPPGGKRRVTEEDPFQLDPNHASPYPGTTFARRVAAASSNSMSTGVDDPGTLPIPSPRSCREPDTGNQLYSLLYPGYPQSLPHITVVQSLARLFFSQFPTLTSELISGARFLFKLTLPPSSEDFPHEALIHAICAMGYLRVGMINGATPGGKISDDIFYPKKEDGTVDRSRKYWGKAESPGEYHYTEAKRCSFMGLCIHEGEGGDGKLKIFEVTRSLVLITYYAYSQNRQLEAWTFAGAALRLCVALGLNHIRDRRSPDAMDRINMLGPGRTGLLPPAQRDEENYERAMTFWLAFLTDRFAGASTGWAFQIQLSDISSFLPLPPAANALDYEGIRRALDMHHPDFLSHHPEELVQPFQLQMKACILLSRVVSFMQHAPWREELCHGIEVRSSEGFKQLDREVVNFRLSFPKTLSIPDKVGVDNIGLYLAHALSHCCTILLHSPYGSLNPEDTSMNRCMTCARAILSTLFLIHDNSMESTFANPFLIFAITTAGRMLVRDVAVKRHLNDLLNAANSETEVQVLIATLSRMGHNLPVCAQTAKTFRSLLQDPSPILRSVAGIRTSTEVADVCPLKSADTLPGLNLGDRLANARRNGQEGAGWTGVGFDDLQNMGLVGTFGTPMNVPGFQTVQER